MYQTLLTSLAEDILTITINRPDKLNALNKTVIAELDEVLEEIYTNAGIRAAIITGTGSKSFVAGADISGFTGLSKEEGRDLAKEGLRVFFKIENAPKPIIAAVNGFALGGGCELAMACHFRLCSENALFGQPEINLGLIPGYGGTQRLTQLIGKGRAMEILLTGLPINAQQALQYGLVNYVTTQEELLERTREVLARITSKAPLAIARCITATNAAVGNKNGYAMETEGFGACFGTNDMREGTTAFLEKRKPVFRGS